MATARRVQPTAPAGGIRRYTTGLICPQCHQMRSVEVAAVDPWTVGFRCERGHKWLAQAERDGAA